MNVLWIKNVNFVKGEIDLWLTCNDMINKSFSVSLTQQKEKIFIMLKLKVVLYRSFQRQY